MRGISFPSPKTESLRVTGDPDSASCCCADNTAANSGSGRLRTDNRIVETACTTAGSCSAGATVQSCGSNPLGTTVTVALVRARSGAAAASLTAFRAIRRATSGVLHGVSQAGSRNAAGRQCTVTVTGKPIFRATRTPAAANGDPTPAWTCTTSKLPRRSAFSIGRDGSGLLAISAGIGIPIAVHGHREFPRAHPAGQRRGGDHLRLQADLLLPPGQVVDLHLNTAQPGDEAVGDVRNPHHPTRLTDARLCCRGPTRSEPCDMLARCRTRSSSSTPIPTTRLCSPPGPWRSSRRRVIGWCWSSRRRARPAWPPAS